MVCVGLSEPVRERWHQCVTGGLADINKLNTIEMVSFVAQHGLWCLPVNNFFLQSFKFFLKEIFACGIKARRN